jgi:TonB-linked SusC/RagA family outer membrane protein
MKFNALFKRRQFACTVNQVLPIVNLILQRIKGIDQRKIIMRINLTIMLITATLLQVSAASYAQKITIHKTNASLQEVIKELRKQSGYDFIYTSPQMKQAKPVTVSVTNGSLLDVLEASFEDQPFTFAIDDKTIIIKNRVRTLELQKQQAPVRGVVLDERGSPIPGASIRIKGTNARATVSGKDGRFLILPISNSDVLQVSYVGYKTYEIKIKPSQELLTIKLEPSEVAMDNVVITGTGITRNKNSFTGATAVFTGDQLKSIGNNNVVQSLRTLDPSFVINVNNLAGSNPNVMPQIEVRGKSSVPSASLKDQFGSDPNQPLFILDGFEATLQTIIDLDMNRVGSLTLLKDAASTALYGARASNGVVVIETIRPKSGELQFTYSNDFRVELPDVSGYNMMNATEKLEFERLSGRYSAEPGSPALQVYLDSLYNVHLSSVKKGVNSYWLNEPLQTGFSNNSSIFAQGGDQHFTYGLGMNYKTQSGAMKGSGRNSYGGTVNLTYRKNKLNINNVTYIRGFSATESPYGSFSNFVNANPYYIKNSTDRYLEQSHPSSSILRYVGVKNPLFDAALPNYDRTKNMEIQNNLNIAYDLTADLKIVGSLQITKGNQTQEIFIAPENSVFEDVGVLEKGTYSNAKRNNFSYQSNLLATYYKTFAEKHVVNASVRGTINENSVDNFASVAQGFPAGSNGNPRFAYGYKPNAAPTASAGLYRTLNVTFSGNYAYDDRYLFDLSYRLDGSTAFGNNKQFSPYYAVGTGWNLHKEQFLLDTKWINRLKLYGNIGVTGNQNYGSITSISVYDYNSNVNYNQFGQGLSLTILGNPDLAPQKTTQISLGLDFSMFNNRLSGYINAYNKKTDPLVVAVDLPSSTGVFAYPMNVGNLTYNGVEAKVSYAPIYKMDQRIVWMLTATAAMYKSKYGGFSNTLNSLNTKQALDKTLLRFNDGYSAEAIWAAKSVGIDPTTGREVFVRKDGQYSFNYTEGDVQMVGNTVPKIEGVMTSNFSYKGFNFGVNLRYRFGADIFNNALYTKVENINFDNITLNQDRRALYDRWKNPGDVARFKGIAQTSTQGAISSRFVQRENTITAESINIGYTFERKEWMRKFGLSMLNVNAISNETFRISSVRSERGIDYPFARTVSLSLRASF